MTPSQLEAFAAWLRAWHRRNNPQAHNQGTQSGGDRHG